MIVYMFEVFFRLEYKIYYNSYNYNSTLFKNTNTVAVTVCTLLIHVKEKCTFH